MDEPDETRVDDEGGQPADDAPAPAAAPGRHPVDGTGHPAVDAVLASLEGLDDKPVREHVAVFESAHEQLRRALDEADDEPNPEPNDEPNPEANTEAVVRESPADEPGRG